MRVIANPFDVAQFTATPSGFTVQFDRPFDSGKMNLHDVQAGTFGPADVVLVGNAEGRVAGSLVLSADTLTFVATGGPLRADTYTVRLRSADDGFVDLSGQRLDGDGDGVAGNDFVRVFSAAPQPIVIGLPDFSRGPGQPVDVPANQPGLPLTLTDNRPNGPGIQTVDVTIDYDPALLTVTAAVRGPDAPAGATLSADTQTPGRIVLSLSGLAGSLPAGALHLVTLIAEVPSTAAYGTTGRLVLADVQVTGAAGASLAATADDAIHVAAYFGDATGNGQYSALDAQRVARIGVGLDGGLRFSPPPIRGSSLTSRATGQSAAWTHSGSRWKPPDSTRPRSPRCRSRSGWERIPPTTAACPTFGPSYVRLSSLTPTVLSLRLSSRPRSGLAADRTFRLRNDRLSAADTALPASSAPEVTVVEQPAPAATAARPPRLPRGGVTQVAGHETKLPPARAAGFPAHPALSPVAPLTATTSVSSASVLFGRIHRPADLSGRRPIPRSAPAVPIPACGPMSPCPPADAGRMKSSILPRAKKHRRDLVFPPPDRQDRR